MLKLIKQLNLAIFKIVEPVSMLDRQAVLIEFIFPEEQTGEQVAACQKHTESLPVITLTARRGRQNFCTADLTASGL